MIKPLGDRVVIEAIAKGGNDRKRYRPAGHSEGKPQEGRIVAVGSGTLKDGERIPLEVKEGDRVIFSKYAGTEVKYDGRELLIMRESDILAILA